MQKIVIAGDESNAVVDAGLRDQAISKPRATALSYELRAQTPRSFPITRRRFEQGKLGKHTG
jgi:hypothetical protein